MKLICIRCPLGCRVSVEGGRATGNGCPRGEQYALEELNDPRRTVTCLLRVNGAAEPLSVKTAEPIPKRLVRECVAQIKAQKPALPIKIGEVILSDVCGTGVSVVATKNIG